MPKHYKEGDDKYCGNCIYVHLRNYENPHSICWHGTEIAERLGTCKRDMGIEPCWEPWIEGSMICSECEGSGLDKESGLCRNCQGIGVISA